MTTQGDFRIHKTDDAYYVKCKVCFTSAQGGRRPSTKVKTAREVREWIGAHEHTDLRTVEAARREARRVWRDANPGEYLSRIELRQVVEAAEKRVQLAEVERIAEFNLKERTCFLCGDDPAGVQTRNSPDGRGIQVVVLCAAHLGADSMWSHAEQNDAARIPT